jgi:poly-gamma-glutamate synthesis protein (capsule biosynthesis protein)
MTIPTAPSSSYARSIPLHAVTGVLLVSLCSATALSQSRAPVTLPGSPDTIMTNRYNPDYPAGPPYQASPPRDQFPYRDLRPELANKMRGAFSIVVTGDINQSTPVAKRISPALLAVLQGGDLTIGNFESNLGTRPDLLAQDMADLGYDLMAPGEDGDAATLRKLFWPVGIQIAGSGLDLNDARRPVFKELPQGQVSFIAACPGIDLCGDPASNGGFNPAKPGVNPIGLKVWNVVTKEQFDQLWAIRASMLARRGEPDVALPSADAPPEAPGRLTFLNQRYMIGEKPGNIHYEIEPADEQAITLSIRNAKEMSDFAIFHMHVHENRYTFQQYSMDHYPVDFMQPFLHKLIDNGLDMYVGSGNHSMQGIEIYKGRPIFYNLGNLGVDVGKSSNSPVTPDGMTSMEKGERIWSNVMGEPTKSAFIAKLNYKAAQLVEIQIFPVELNIGSGVWSREHIPATPTLLRAREILEDIQRYSAPFGTKIVIQNGIGIIKVAPTSTASFDTLDIPGRQATSSHRYSASPF